MVIINEYITTLFLWLNYTDDENFLTFNLSLLFLFITVLFKKLSYTYR